MGHGERDDAFARFAASSIGSLLAETATLPTDVAKTRLQVQKTAQGKLHYTGLLDCFAKVKKTEGIRGLWKGLIPALVRQVSYSSLSLVLFEKIRDGICTADEIEQKKIPFWKSLAGAGTAGVVNMKHPLRIRYSECHLHILHIPPPPLRRYLSLLLTPQKS